MSTKQVFFIAGGDEKVTLPSPPLSGGTQYQWLWTPHDGRQFQLIATISENKWTYLNSQNLFSQGDGHDLSMESQSSAAGVFLFTQTEPNLLPLSRFEVFAVECKLTSFSLLYVASDILFVVQTSPLSIISHVSNVYCHWDCLSLQFGLRNH